MRISNVESDDGEYSVVIRDPTKGLYAVVNRSGSRRSRNGVWHYEPLPSSRSDEWIKNHSFTFKEAMNKLKKLERGKIK